MSVHSAVTEEQQKTQEKTAAERMMLLTTNPVEEDEDDEDLLEKPSVAYENPTKNCFCVALFRCVIVLVLIF